MDRRTREDTLVATITLQGSVNVMDIALLTDYMLHLFIVSASSP